MPRFDVMARSILLTLVLGGVCSLAVAQAGGDPNLDPSMQDDYRPEDHPELTEAPPAGWQVAEVIASPFGAVYYLVDDADGFVRQLPAAVARRVMVRRRAETGLAKDLVVDPVGNRGGARRGSYGSGHGRVVLGNAEGGFYFGTGVLGGFPFGWGTYYRVGYPLSRRLGPGYGRRVGDPELRYLYVGPIDGGYSPGYQPGPVEGEEALPPPTALELGLAALQDGEADEAITLLRGHLDAFPADAAAARVLAIALLAGNRPADAGSVMRLAYVRDPRLGARAIEGERLLDDDDGTDGSGRLRKLATRAAKHAARVDSASGWLLACVLTQARDKPKPALTMLDRAAGRGLEADVVRVLRVELER